MTNPTITISARKFFALVDAVTPFAGRDRFDLPLLSCVRIESRGTHLLAMSTDRYRVGIKRLAADDGAWPAFEATVQTSTLASVKAMFRPQRGMDSDLTLTVEDGLLHVEASGALLDVLAASATYDLQHGEFPKLFSLVEEAIKREPGAEPFGVNAKFFADFGKTGSPNLMVKPSGSKPLIFADGEDFVGLLMPCKTSADGAFPDLTDWLALFDPAKKPAVKKDPAKRKGAAA